MTKQEIFNRYIPNIPTPSSKPITAFAPSNIALCKYWGKRDIELNLPTNSSLSISLGNLGTTTTISLSETGKDCISLNGQWLDEKTSFMKKVFSFVDFFRKGQNIPLCIETVNTIPTAAGLASSASGFGALTIAIDKFFQLNLDTAILSAFARMGSGSASRSLYNGFVEWHKGRNNDGMDSFAEPVTSSHYWNDLCVGIVSISTESKKINSRDGMIRTVETSSLYKEWPQQAQRDIQTLKQAIQENDFIKLGETAEHNALSMHATMISAFPPILYWQPQSVAAMHKVWELRNKGIEVYLTMDAGPNIKLLFKEQDKSSIVEEFKAEFGEITVVMPFVL